MLGTITKELWVNLTKDYILALQDYDKVRGEKFLKEGDVVLILDKTLPSGRYAVGRIKKAITNPDGKARSFDVDHHGETIRRSIMTLAPLEGLSEVKSGQAKQARSSALKKKEIINGKK